MASKCKSICSKCLHPGVHFNFPNLTILTSLTVIYELTRWFFSLANYSLLSPHRQQFLPSWDSVASHTSLPVECWRGGWLPAAAPRGWSGTPQMWPLMKPAGWSLLETEPRPWTTTSEEYHPTKRSGCGWRSFTKHRPSLTALHYITESVTNLYLHQDTAWLVPHIEIETTHTVPWQK